MLPSCSVRVTRRVTKCSQVTSRPCRSRALPLAKFAGDRKTLKLSLVSSYFMIRLFGMSLTSK